MGYIQNQCIFCFIASFAVLLVILNSGLTSDLYIVGSKHSFVHRTMVENVVMRLFSNGEIYYSVKYEVCFVCNSFVIEFIASVSIFKKQKNKNCFFIASNSFNITIYVFESTSSARGTDYIISSSACSIDSHIVIRKNKLY